MPTLPAGTTGQKKFAKWMAKGPPKERGQTAVARKLGVAQPTVREWLLGTSRPSPTRRTAIEVLTDKEVEASDWDRPAEKKALRDALKRIAKPAPSP